MIEATTQRKSRKPLKPRALILRAPGINCERETAQASASAGAEAEVVALRELASSPQRLFDYGLLIIPGGFSHGDYLGAGTLLAAELLTTIGAELQRFVDEGRLILGICNGFQALARLGLLPDIALAPNHNGLFECRWTELRAEQGTHCIFTRGIDRLTLPIAHGEGRLVPRDAAALARLEQAGCVALRYATANGGIAQTYPDNPNGSAGAVAGICNLRGTVLGLMPHPERASLPHQALAGHGLPGLQLFSNAVRYLQEAEAPHGR